MAMPRIAFIGDPHGEWDSIMSRLLPLRPDYAVIVGDMVGHGGPPYPTLRDCVAPAVAAGIQVRWIHGNHDSDRAELLESTFGTFGEHNISGRVEDFGGVRIGGLGGVFRGRVWTPGETPKFESREAHLRTFPKHARYKDQLPVKHWTTIYPSDVEQISAQPMDILVTHEAGSGYAHEERGVYGYEVFDQIARATDASILIHGHHHYSYARFLGDGRLCVGLGLAEVSLLDDIVSAGPRQGPL